MRRNQIKGNVKATSPVGCSLLSAALRKIVPSKTISPRRRHRSRGTLTYFRTSLKGLVSMRPGRTACSNIACTVEIVRETSPSPPLIVQARLPACGFAVLPTAISAISACAPSMLRSFERANPVGPKEQLCIRFNLAAIHQYRCGLNWASTSLTD